MSDGQAWVFGIIAFLIFLAVATAAANITRLNILLEKGSGAKSGLGAAFKQCFVECGQISEYSQYTFINPSNVTFLEILTHEGGTRVHLVGGGTISVYEDDVKKLAGRLGVPIRR